MVVASVPVTLGDRHGLTGGNGRRGGRRAWAKDGQAAAEPRLCAPSSDPGCANGRHGRVWAFEGRQQQTHPFLSAECQELVAAREALSAQPRLGSCTAAPWSCVILEAAEEIGLTEPANLRGGVSQPAAEYMSA